MSLLYTIFEGCALVFSLIMINLLLSGGKSDYFKVVLLVAVYLVLSQAINADLGCCCNGMVLSSGWIDGTILHSVGKDGSQQKYYSNFTPQTPTPRN